MLEEILGRKILAQMGTREQVAVVAEYLISLDLLSASREKQVAVAEVDVPSNLREFH